MTVPGMSVRLDVVSARKVHMALDATPGVGLRRARSSIALSPSGVAAFPRPRMLAVSAMMIDALAG